MWKDNENEQSGVAHSVDIMPMEADKEILCKWHLFSNGWQLTTLR